MAFSGLRGSLRKKLWLGWFCLAVLIVSMIGANAIVNKNRAFSRADFGLDFIAFYRAGVLLQRGDANQLYDLQATRQFDQELVKKEGLHLGNTFGLFYNPPFYAWVFEPLARLGYFRALLVWSLAGIAFYAASAWLLCRMFPRTADWRDRALIPALMCVSLSFIQAFCSAQNTFGSLLLLTLAVTAWRADRGFWAGFVVGILFYKPQLAAVILLGMIVSVGWRALAGAALSLGTLILINVVTLPGTLTEFVHRLGPNFSAMLAAHSYLWARHATFRGFWQVLLGDNNSHIAAFLGTACSAIVAACLIACIRQNRKVGSRDRLIMALIATTPLVMPYYVDYDLLLLAIPAVLFAAEMIQRNPAQEPPKRDQWLVRFWIALFLLLLINPGLTGTLHMNLSVPVLCAIAGISMVRATETMAIRSSCLPTETFNNPLRMPAAA
jgi:alpha-1,2-mannosyltransferase